MPSSSKLVATLATDVNGAFDEDLLDSLTDNLRLQGALSVDPVWRDEGRAADIFISGLSVTQAYDVLRPYLGSRPVDIIIQSATTQRKKLLLADMESTIIEQEMLDELADLLGLRKTVAEITRRGMNGEIDFAKSLKERTALLKGQPVRLLDDVAQRLAPMPGATGLIAAMKKQGATSWLVSGGFSFFTSIVATQLGFDRSFSNELVIDKGLITGTLKEPIRDGTSKKDTLDQACRELGIAKHDCLAIGDGANDIPMLTACNEGGGLGVAFHAKPAVRNVIQHQINHTSLKTLVYAIN